MASTSEHRTAAQHAGLNYVTDGVPGITRRRAGKGWSFVRPNGKVIVEPKQRQRILSLAVPPAWTDVWICPDIKGHIQVTARDAKGRKQYRYHPDYREARDRSKFRHMFVFSEVLPAVRENAERDLRAPDLSRSQVLATAIRLLDKTLIRIGSDEYARANQSYGLTTLRNRHVQVEGAELRFSFRGKSGIQHALSVTDRRIARIIQRMQDLPGQELFQYVDQSGKHVTITSDDVNSYLQDIAGAKITAKDFRTWGGSMAAGSELRDLGPASGKQETIRNINRALDVVAKRLGNTRTVCRKYYVHPALIEAYEEGMTAGPPAPLRRKSAKAGRGAPALRRDEVVILQFLNDLV